MEGSFEEVPCGIWRLVTPLLTWGVLATGGGGCGEEALVRWPCEGRLSGDKPPPAVPRGSPWGGPAEDMLFGDG